MELRFDQKKFYKIKSKEIIIFGCIYSTNDSYYFIPQMTNYFRFKYIYRNEDTITKHNINMTKDYGTAII